MKILFSTALIFSLIAPLLVNAQITIIDGDLIKTSISNDVFIVKIVPSTGSGQVAEKYKRLILNPEIFNQYGHLKWENIKTVSQSEINEYIISDLVRAVGDDRVYKLYPNNDIGEKRWIKTANDFSGFAYKASAIYEINSFERDYYVTGSDLVYQIPETPIPPTPNREPITINVPVDYTTIQSALNASINGDTISVQSGTYNENLIINKGIKLIGVNPGSVFLNGSGNDNAINVTSGDVLIQRIVVQSQDKYGIYCSGENQTKITIKNSTIKNSGWGIVTENNCQVIALNNLIYNNKNSSNTNGVGILIKNNFSYGITSEIRNNTIDDNYHGIWSENSNVNVMNSIITSNIGGKGIINYGIYDTGDGKLNNSYSDVYGSGDDFGGDATPGNGTIVVFPNFAGPLQRDYRLKTGTTDYSLCIDAGHPEYIYNDINYNGNTARNDMGAYGGPENIGWTP